MRFSVFGCWAVSHKKLGHGLLYVTFKHSRRSTDKRNAQAVNNRLFYHRIWHEAVISVDQTYGFFDGISSIAASQFPTFILQVLRPLQCVSENCVATLDKFPCFRENATLQLSIMAQLSLLYVICRQLNLSLLEVPSPNWRFYKSKASNGGTTTLEFLL